MSSPPFRVLHAAQPTVGGVASYVQQLAGACRDAGLATAVACPRGGELPGWAEANGIEWIEVALQRSPAYRSPCPADRRAAAADGRLRRGAPPLGEAGAISAGSPARRCADPPVVVFTTHGWGWHVGGPLEPAYRAFERLAAPHADVTVAVSDENAAEGRAILGAHAAANLRVITNGVDVDRFRPDGPAAERTDRPLITCVGRLTEAKGPGRPDPCVRGPAGHRRDAPAGRRGRRGARAALAGGRGRGGRPDRMGRQQRRSRAGVPRRGRRRRAVPLGWSLAGAAGGDGVRGGDRWADHRSRLSGCARGCAARPAGRPGPPSGRQSARCWRTPPGARCSGARPGVVRRPCLPHRERRR